MSTFGEAYKRKWMWVLTGTLAGAGLGGALTYRQHHAGAAQSPAPEGAYCDNGIAAVVERHRKRRIRCAVGRCDPIRPTAAFHPRDVDLPTRPQNRNLFAHQAEVAQAFEFSVIGNACLAVAKSDLGPDVEVDLDPAIRRRAAEGFAFAPFVGRMGPLHLRKFRISWGRHGLAGAKHRPCKECRRSGERAEPEANYPCNDGNSFHRSLSASPIL